MWYFGGYASKWRAGEDARGEKGLGSSWGRELEVNETVIHPVSTSVLKTAVNTNFTIAYTSTQLSFLLWYLPDYMSLRD
jgi:hypothetical protein